ncbi:hypothetical protein HDV00_006683 [Rhizophlyctis rosea]|nr:hypothetical protein HDV00_006683 [Rhizophlyctis rosea]
MDGVRSSLGQELAVYDLPLKEPGSNKGIGVSGREDLESVGYMLLYFLRGSLPWVRTRNRKDPHRDEVGRVKAEMPLEVLCRGLPKEFRQFLEYSKKLGFEEDPDYDKWRTLFGNVWKTKKLGEKGRFDWMNYQPISAEHLSTGPKEMLPHICNYCDGEGDFVRDDDFEKRVGGEGDAEMLWAKFDRKFAIIIAVEEGACDALLLLSHLRESKQSMPAMVVVHNPTSPPTHIEPKFESAGLVLMTEDVRNSGGFEGWPFQDCENVTLSEREHFMAHATAKQIENWVVRQCIRNEASLDVETGGENIWNRPPKSSVTSAPREDLLLFGNEVVPTALPPTTNLDHPQPLIQYLDNPPYTSAAPPQPFPIPQLNLDYPQSFFVVPNDPLPNMAPSGLGGSDYAEGVGTQQVVDQNLGLGNTAWDPGLGDIDMNAALDAFIEETGGFHGGGDDHGGLGSGGVGPPGNGDPGTIQDGGMCGDGGGDEGGLDESGFLLLENSTTTRRGDIREMV